MFRVHTRVTNAQVSECRSSAGDDSKHSVHMLHSGSFSICKGFNSNVNLQPKFTSSLTYALTYTRSQRKDTCRRWGQPVGTTEVRQPTQSILWIWAVFCPSGRQVQWSALGPYHITKSNLRLHFFQKCMLCYIFFQNCRLSSVEQVPSGAVIPWPKLLMTYHNHSPSRPPLFLQMNHFQHSAFVLLPYVIIPENNLSSSK